MKKYEFTGETQTVSTASKEVTFHRIRALAGFGTVSAGELGGWIEKEENLSHEGDAWIGGNAKVYGDAEVYGNAEVYDNAQVCDNAQVYDNARVYGNAWVYGDAWVYNNARVYGDAQVYGDAWVRDHAQVCDNAQIHGDADVCDNARVHGDADVYDNARVCDNAEVYGDAQVCSNAQVHDDADVFLPNHILVIGPVGSRNAFTTFYRGSDNQIIVKCGCFSGTLKEFLDKVKKTHGDNHHALVYRAAAEIAKLRISLKDEIPKKESESC